LFPLECGEKDGLYYAGGVGCGGCDLPNSLCAGGEMLYAHRVTTYLMQDMHYSRQELASVQGKWTVKTPPFLVVVRFSDEPEVEYTYFAHNDVLQFSHEITPEGLRQGITNSQLQHYVPME
jgi:hypothetical protein